MANWNKITVKFIAEFKDEDGLINEFKLLYALRNRFPIHFSLFKRLAAHLPHEANAETTFSLSGSLSSSNTHTTPEFLSTCVRINKNKKIYNPSRDEVYKAYRSKFGKSKHEDELCYASGSDSEAASEEEDNPNPLDADDE